MNHLILKGTFGTVLRPSQHTAPREKMNFWCFLQNISARSVAPSVPLLPLPPVVELNGWRVTAGRPERIRKESPASHTSDLPGQRQRTNYRHQSTLSLIDSRTINLIRIEHEFKVVMVLLHKLEPKPGHDQTSFE